jgi:hypothetical protein
MQSSKKIKIGQLDTSKLISANYTASNNDNLIVNATCTITDVVSPVNGSNYEVTVVSGNVTIGGVVYTVGNCVKRVFNSGSWVTVVNYSEWIDYSEISTIVGFSSFTTKNIFIKCIDKTTSIVLFNISGTSNSNNATFTVNKSNNGGFINSMNALIVNNGATSLTSGRILMANNSDIVDVRRDANSQAYTSSGGKTISGQIIFKHD